MPTVTYNLKAPKAIGKNLTPIRMVFAFGKKHIILSTGIMILPKNWNPEKNRLRISRLDDMENVNINTRLDKIEKRVLMRYRDHISENDTLYIDKLTVELREILRPSGTIYAERMTFVKAIEVYIESCNKKPNTKKHYVTTLNAIKEYEKTQKRPIEFEDIDLTFYDKFVRWCEAVPYAMNTIGSHIKQIKVFMNYAIDQGWTRWTGHLNRRFKIIEETADTIYLSEEKIIKIYNLDLAKRKNLERERDLYVIDCYTGLRYQDLHQITPDKFIKEGSQIKIKTYKTDKTVVIPLHPVVKEIIKKYNGTLPAPSSDQQMNRSLKIFGWLAGLKARIPKAITIGGKRIQKTYFEWQLITVHTARRSFATNATLAGVPKERIMLITGHTVKSGDIDHLNPVECDHLLSGAN